MEVEPVGVSASETPKQSEKSETGKSKVWFFVLCGLFVVIVGLVIAIVVVKNLPREGEFTVSDTDMVEYYSVSDDVWKDIVDNNSEMSGEDILALYEKKIEETTDDTLRLMLTMDYYNFVIMYDIEETKKDEVKSAMLAADEKLQTPLSASNVIAMAISYGDQELESRYNEILNERIAAMGDEDKTTVNDVDADTEKNKDINNEGVGIILYEKANA